MTGCGELTLYHCPLYSFNTAQMGRSVAVREIIANYSGIGVTTKAKLHAHNSRKKGYFCTVLFWCEKKTTFKKVYISRELLAPFRSNLVAM